MDLWSIVGGSFAMGICAFCYMWDLCGVMVQHGSFVIRVVHLTYWYVNSAICETYWVYWCRIDLCTIGGLSAIGIYAFCYRWILFGVMVLHRSMLIWRRVWGQSAIGICAFFYICNWLGVMVLHRSMLIWGSICHGYMCLLLYVRPMGCNGAARIFWH